MLHNSKTPGSDPACEVMSFLLPRTLSMKKSLKLWASSFDDFPVGNAASVERCSRCLDILCKAFLVLATR